MEKDQQNEMREYAWRYFSLHADQRMKTFNFFLVLVAVLGGGLLSFVKDARYPPLGGLPGGMLLVVLSWIFWKLDCRNRQLIHHAEKALQIIEATIPESDSPKELRLFTEENREAQSQREARRLSWSPKSWISAHYSYRDCFGAMFLITGIYGVGFAIGSFFIPSSKDAPIAVPQQNSSFGSQTSTPTAAR